MTSIALTQKGEPMDDLISRRAAVDEIMRIKSIAYLPDWNDAIRRSTAEYVLKCLPSAEAVITCDGCRFVSTYDTDFPCCSCVRREKDYYEPER